MKLFYSPGACSLSPHILLREAGLSFTPVRVDLKTHKTEDGADFYAISAKGYVPALQLDDGSMLTEGVAIDLWIADQVPAAGLAPRDGMDRYRMIELLTFIATELHKNMGGLFVPGLPDATREMITQRLTARLGLIEQQRPHLADRRAVHGGRRLPVHGRWLGQVGQVRPVAVAGAGRLPGPRGGAAGGTGGAEGRRSHQVRVDFWRKQAPAHLMSWRAWRCSTR
jgi:glutathione S-transferase